MFWSVPIPTKSYLFCLWQLVGMCNNIYDVVRGAVVYSTMKGYIQALQVGCSNAYLSTTIVASMHSTPDSSLPPLRSHHYHTVPSEKARRGRNRADARKGTLRCVVGQSASNLFAVTKLSLYMSVMHRTACRTTRTAAGATPCSTAVFVMIRLLIFSRSNFTTRPCSPCEKAWAVMRHTPVSAACWSR